VKAGVGERVARGLSAPEVLSDGFDRMLAVAQRLQIAVGVIALLAVWLLPGGEIDRREQLTVTALLVGVYLPWTVLSRHTALLAEGAVARVLNLAVDLLAIASFALVIPETRTAIMFGYVLVIAFHSYVSGRAAGLSMCCASLVLVLLAEALAPRSARTDGFTLVLYGVVMVALAIMVDALAAERRRTARHLGRLYRALENVAGDPSLSATTDSIAEAAREAVGAGSVAVFLVRDDVEGGVQVAGHSGFPDDAQSPLRTAVKDLANTPAGLAMRSGRPVSIPDVRADERYRHLLPVYEQFDVAGLVTLPLGSPVRPIGVLNAYFATPDAFDEEDVHLLAAYARQASTTVARALAFEQERKASARLADADQLKSDFVSTISHELRTPLTSISGFVDTILLQWDRLDDDAKRALLERTSWNASELRRLIEQVLAFSALEGPGHVIADLRPYDLAAGVGDLVDHMAPALRDCPVRVDIEPGLTVLADTQTIHHVVGNLLTNAAKFSPAGSPISVVGRRDGSVCRLSVTDRGPGIPAEDQARIFDRFYRGSATRSTRGTGIGLAIVRASLEAIGGSVSVRSEPGLGSTFEVTVPLADAVADVEVDEPAIVLR
jgi:signal transduction histidine kinase